MGARTRLINLAVGPALMVLLTLLLPESVFTTFQSRAAIGTVAWMAYWWVTGPVDYAVTALLPIAVNAVLQITDMSTVVANYSSETIMLLLGASIVTVSWEETGLDRRIAAKLLGLIGSGFRSQLVFWLLLSVVLSSVLPNAVVCATVTPIALSMLKFVGEGNIAESRMGSRLLMYIAYGAGLGGLATPLGGAMNLVTVDYLQQLTGQEFMYVDWAIRFAPIMVVLLAITMAFMLRGVKKEETLGASKEFFQAEYAKMPPMAREEVVVLGLFVLATILAFTRQFYAGVLPGLKPAYVFIIAGILTFLVTRKQDGTRLMVWKSVQGKIIWELIFIFAGGLAVGTLISGSGAAANIGEAVSAAGLTGGFVTVLVIITLTLLLSDVTSNTATAAVAIPIVISIVQGFGENPIPYVYIASIGVNLSFMLPTSVRAIPVGHGLPPKIMLKEGWKITLVVIACCTVLSYVLMTWWPAFSTV
ncbi:MAG: SLC13 family permease [Eggerthellales bacterium]|nr:SLC13 family permease [Eggerthellales bacterium]